MTEQTPESTPEPTPWWFSGDDAQSDPTPPAPVQSAPVEPAPVEPGPVPSEPERSTSPSEASESSDETGPGLADVVAGLGALVGWARERVIDPHLEHEHPSDHPDCVICRGMVVVQRLAGEQPDGEQADTRTDAGHADGERGAHDTDDGLADDDIAWVPLTRTGRAGRRAGSKSRTRIPKDKKGKGASWG